MEIHKSHQHLHEVCDAPESRDSYGEQLCFFTLLGTLTDTLPHFCRCTGLQLVCGRRWHFVTGTHFSFGTCEHFCM
jgi:hypothetical protein